MGFFSLSRDIGIDLGTFSTRIYFPHRGVVFNEPSVLAKDLEEGNELLCIGKRAREMVGRTDTSIDLHPIVFHGSIKDEVFVESYLSAAISRLRNKFSFLRSDMLVNVPVGATSMEQRAIVQACKRAGARHVYTEVSVVLAALGTGVDRDELRGQMVTDIGAGVTESAVISLGGVSSHKSIPVGGNCMDEAIVQHVKKRYQLLISKENARRAKEMIGSVLIKDSPEEVRVKGSDCSTKLPRIVKITSNDIAEAIQHEVEKILENISNVFQGTPPELTSDIIERGIVLTGGVANIKDIATAVEHHVNAPVYIAEDAEQSVVRGLGKSIQTGQLEFHKRLLLSK